jgi:hypothetical protein
LRALRKKKFFRNLKKCFFGTAFVKLIDKPGFAKTQFFRLWFFVSAPPVLNLPTPPRCLV